MSDDRTVAIKLERLVIPYREFWHTANVLLNLAKNQEDGRLHLLVSSLTFRAFALEAFFNHIGRIDDPEWEQHQWSGFDEKPKELGKLLGVAVNYGQAPWSVIRELKQFRDAVAHGSTGSISKEAIEPLATYDDATREWRFRTVRKRTKRACKYFCVTTRG